MLIALLVGVVPPGQRPVALAGQFGVRLIEANIVQEVQMDDEG